MFLQTLFALYSLCPAIIASVPSPIVGDPVVVHHTIVVQGGHRFVAELFSPRREREDSRYPGAIIIATDETRDRAFLLASRMAEIGVTVLMYPQDPDKGHTQLVEDARAAVDSVRRRSDVRSEEVGVIALEEATTIVPDLASDTLLNFAIAASATDRTRDGMSRYAKVRAVTLLVRGVKNASDSVAIVHRNGPAGPRPSDSIEGDTTLPISQLSPAPNVTVWPVPLDQLKDIGDAHSPLGIRVVSWVREQVHATLVAPDETPVVTP